MNGGGEKDVDYLREANRDFAPIGRIFLYLFLCAKAHGRLLLRNVHINVIIIIRIINDDCNGFTE